MLVAILGSGPARAQGTTTAWEAVVPDAALCQAQPRTVDHLVALFANATPVAAADGSDHAMVPTGQTASSVLAAEVTATVHAAFACLNSGQWFRFMGLLTDHAIVTAFPWLANELAMGVVPNEISTPSPLPADLVQTIIAVADVTTLGNDRVGAFVIFLDPASGNPGPHVLHLVFVRSGSGWLIDDVVEFSNE